MDAAEDARPERTTDGDVGTTEASVPRRTPRPVRRVVCAYRIDSLPGAWLQTWRRLERVLERAGLKVKATLAPLDELPEDTGIVVVPPELRDAARVSAPEVPLLVTTPAAAPDAFADLVKRLEAGTDLTAERVDPAEQAAPKIVTYRGSTRLD